MRVEQKWVRRRAWRVTIGLGINLGDGLVGEAGMRGNHSPAKKLWRGQARCHARCQDKPPSRLEPVLSCMDVKTSSKVGKVSPVTPTGIHISTPRLKNCAGRPCPAPMRSVVTDSCLSNELSPYLDETHQQQINHDGDRHRYC